MQDHWEILDVYKALLSLGAGIILGLEREWKDKAAGLKTISIICLGATLFAIISMKLDVNNPTALAAYIVSGVGFIGAGAIFRNGYSVTGLTTAGIIWLAAAVGTSIGFGEFYLAATFVSSSLLVIIATPLFNKIFAAPSQARPLVFTISRAQYLQKEILLDELKKHALSIAEKKVEADGEQVTVTAEVMLKNNAVAAFKQLLAAQPMLLSFSF
jgi:putative Mg2+ transporter-C (MgtC) family protein